MKTIVFLNNKGGVGKTASVTTVAHMLATKYNQRVLQIDLDPQGNTSSLYDDMDIISVLRSMLTNSPIDNPEKTVEDLLINPSVDIHETIKHTKYSNLDIIPALLTLAEAEERLKADIRIPQQFRLKSHLANIQDEYDYCIMDCSPSISIININGLTAADAVYIPIRCDAYSAIGMCIAKNLMQTVKTYNHNLTLGGVFFTQWEGHKNVSKTVLELLQAFIPKDLLPMKIRKSVKMEELSFMQQPLLDYDPRVTAPVTKDYLALTEYIFTH